MDILSCMVSVGSDASTVVFKQSVSPAELYMLRELNGELSVTDVKKVGTTDKTSKDEMERLRQVYTLQDGTGAKVAVLERLFGKVAANLPMTYEAVKADFEFRDQEGRSAVDLQLTPGKTTLTAEVEPDDEVESVDSDAKESTPAVEDPDEMFN